MRVMRLPSTVMFIGPAGGAPVPSISMTPRMVRVLNGPRPSFVRRADAAVNPPACWTKPAVLWGTFVVAAACPCATGTRVAPNATTPETPSVSSRRIVI
jgi:hypothetical protein